MQPTRKRIIAAAMDMIERNGVEAVSMESLATELGCGLLSLYSQVPSRSALLDGVTDTLLADALLTDTLRTDTIRADTIRADTIRADTIRADTVRTDTVRTDAAIRPTGDWPDYVRAQATAFWQVARTHPRCCRLVLTRPSASTAALRSLETALASLREAGFAGPESVRIVRVVAAFLMGLLLREVGEAPGVRDGDAGDDRQRKRPSAAAFPHVTDMRADLASADPDGDFEFGLELLVRARPSDARESADLVYPAVRVRELAELNPE